MFKNLTHVLVLICLFFCSMVYSHHTVEVIVPSNKSYKNAEFLNQQPECSSIKVALVHVDNSPYSNFEHLVKEAQDAAKEIGGDFILLQDSGTDVKTVYPTAKPTCSAVSNCQQAETTFTSMGLTLETYESPWAIFSVWKYLPSN